MCEKTPTPIGYKSVIDLGRDARVYPPHTLGDYPTKILPSLVSGFIERFTRAGMLVCDPFGGSGTVAVECARLGRRAITLDINPRAAELTRQKLAALETDTSDVLVLHADARRIPLADGTVDAIVTDPPYADMIRYSDRPDDLSTIDDYGAFLRELDVAFGEMTRVLKPERYCVVFVSDYRLARRRVVLPLHADVIALMSARGMELFDLYVWRYYRSGAFRPFGARPYQAMNTHSYILVFFKPASVRPIVKNRPVRYRPRLKLKLAAVRQFNLGDTAGSKKRRK
jgi:ubiquinone/menaquinone biosynthesis C-methylase UbiE